MDVVPNDEEIVRETHRLHRVQLELDPVDDYLAEVLAVFAVRSFVSQVVQVDVRIRVAVGHLELRKERVVVDLVYFDLIGDFNGVFKDFRVIGEKFGHLILSLKVLLLSVAHARRVVHVAVRGEAYKPVVRRAVLLVHEMDVVRSYDLDAVLPGQLEFLLGDDKLPVIDRQVPARNLRPMLLDLQIIVVAEDVAEPFHSLFSRGQVSCYYLSRHLACQAGGRADYTLVVLFQHRTVDSRTVIESIREAQRYDPAEIMVPQLIFG